MNRLVAIGRMIRILLWMLIFLLHSRIGCLFKKGRARRQFQVELISFYSRRLLKSLDYEVVPQDLQIPSGAFVVANHLSYVDILCIASVTQAIFVTSTEMRDSPFLGDLCRAGGSIFVNRRRHFVSRSELNEIMEALGEGFRVVVFPEATSSDGSGLLPFKRGLFRAAQRAGAPLVSLCLNYEEMDDRDQNPNNRICYYGDLTFGPHLFSLAATPPMKARITTAHIETLENSGDLKDSVQHSRARIETLFRPLWRDLESTEGLKKAAISF